LHAVARLGEELIFIFVERSGTECDLLEEYFVLYFRFMSNKFSPPLSKTPSARYSLGNIDAKDRQDVTSSCIDLEDAGQKTRVKE
jgi:hypothetical protein